MRAAADVALLELSVGGYTAIPSHSPGDRISLLRVRAARVEFGAEVTDHIGVTAGTMLAEGWTAAPSYTSILPISARVYWDFTPNELWVRRTAYIAATFHHTGVISGDAALPSYLAMGATFTWRVLTARAELFAPLHHRALGLSIGVEVGGSYIVGRHHQSGRTG